jgi:hypothetical protein
LFIPNLGYGMGLLPDDVDAGAFSLPFWGETFAPPVVAEVFDGAEGRAVEDEGLAEGVFDALDIV